MGKQVKRVPINFDWPINKTWWGYELREVVCQTCAGMGRLFQLRRWTSFRRAKYSGSMTPNVVQPAMGKGEFARSLKSPEERGINFGTQRITGAQFLRFLRFPRNWHPGLPRKEFMPLQFSHCPTSNGWILFSRRMKRSPVSSKVIWISIWTAWTLSALNFIEEVFAAPPEETKA